MLFSQYGTRLEAVGRQLSSSSLIRQAGQSRELRQIRQNNSDDSANFDSQSADNDKCGIAHILAKPRRFSHRDDSTNLGEWKSKVLCRQTDLLPLNPISASREKSGFDTHNLWLQAIAS